MALTLHPDAATNFAIKADALVATISVSPIAGPKQSFPSETYAMHEITPELIVGEVRSGAVDFKGDEISRFIVREGKEIGLDEKAYIAYDALSRAVQRSSSLHDTVSLRSVKADLFDWLIARYDGREVQTFPEFALPRLESRIRAIQIWVPIFATQIESCFVVGRVSFLPITKPLMDKWEGTYAATSSADKLAQLHQYFEKERKDLQGFAAGTIDVIADPTRAEELAIFEVERSLNLVKFFEPTNLHPAVSSHSTILGKQHLQSTKVLHVADGLLTNDTTALIDKGSIYWRMDNDFISMMRKTGLDTLSAILVSKTPSEFQLLLVDALQLYARVGLAKTYSDKLVYIFSTLESLLLKDGSESIQQNVAERLAFALEVDPDIRRRVVWNFRRVYAMRSDFLHHGNDVPPDQVDALAELMFNAWRFLQRAIHNAGTIQSKVHLIDEIERIKFA
jgi:hypothetical protein